jgi:hypothetical protein
MLQYVVQSPKNEDESEGMDLVIIYGSCLFSSSLRTRPIVANREAGPSPTWEKTCIWALPDVEYS